MASSGATPRFIYFDLGDVLLHFDHWIACRNLGNLADVDPERVWQVIFDSDLETRYETGLITREEFAAELCRGIGRRLDVDSVCHAHGAIFWRNHSIVPVVAALESAGYPMGLLSNTCDSHWEYVANGRYSLIPASFRAIALSFRLKAMKPDALIYERAAELAGYAPHEIFFIDDRPINVEGARKAGYDAVLYTTTPALVTDLRSRGFRFNY